jgi:rSAM/selenodomain-associated transferase 1
MVDDAQADVVGILTRAPSAGGKSRLFASLGCAPDPVLLSSLLLDTLDRVPASLPRVVAVEPADGCDEVRALVPAGVQVVPQSGGTIGERMRELMRALFAGGAARVALIGSDLPSIASHAVLEAFACLRRDPGSLVLGPADDGGYYLIAATRVPEVFDDIEWGSARVLAQTRDAAARTHPRVHLIAAARDVDTRVDLEAALGPSAPRTTAWAAAHGIVQPDDD